MVRVSCRGAAKTSTDEDLLGEPPARVSGRPPEVVKWLDYSVEVECCEPETRHWRHPWCYKRNGGKLAARPTFMPQDMACDLATFTNRSAQLYRHKPCLGTRPITRQVHDEARLFWYKGDYEWQTYGDMIKNVHDCAAGLLALDQVMILKSEGNCTAAILADTSAEWQMAAQSSLQAGITITTVYTTLGHTAMVHALNETEAPVLFMDWVQFPLLEKNVLCKSPALKHIVLIGKCWVPHEVVGGERKPFPLPREAAAMQRDCTAMVTTMDGLIALGRMRNLNMLSMGPIEDDVALMMYTSGSTGTAKGVMLTHKNYVSLLAGVLAQDSFKPLPNETYIAYLPLAHIFEFCFEIGMLAMGGMIGYGSPKTLTAASPYMCKDNPEGSDLMSLQPALMCGVPLVLDAIKAYCLIKLHSIEGFKGKLVRTAVRHAQGKKGEEHPMATILSMIGLNRHVIKMMKKQLGFQNLRLMGSGGAPLAADTQTFISRVLAPVAQGYGCTESTCLTTLQEVLPSDGRPADRSAGRVGPVLPSLELKLQSVPDLGYRVTDTPPAGEILVGGPQVTQLGYFKRRSATQRDFPCDANGQRWFRTGDIGCIWSDGSLKIVDRIKDIIKLSGGEYVALSKVEAALKQVRGILACVVFARPEKAHCVVIVSQPERGWSSVGGRPDEEKLLPAIRESLEYQRLASFEIPHGVKVDDETWTPDTGLITGSMKVQRAKLRRHYNKPGGLLAQMDYQFPDVPDG